LADDGLEGSHGDDAIIDDALEAPEPGTLTLVEGGAVLRERVDCVVRACESKPLLVGYS
jgi:hypothetical protein